MSITKPVLGSQIQLGHPLARGLVGHLPFNENSGSHVHDLSGNGNHGTLIDDTAWVATERGIALEFDGNGDYLKGDSAAFYFPDQTFTVSAWVHQIGYAASGMVMTQGGWAESGWRLEMGIAGEVTLRLFGSDNFDVIKVDTNATFSLDQWHHVVAVVTTSTVSNIGNMADIYVDGVEQASTIDRFEEVDAYADGASDWRIGAGGEEAPAESPLTGRIAHVSIYNRGLSAAEISWLYREPYAMFEQEPIELWTASAVTTTGGPGYYQRRRRVA